MRRLSAFVLMFTLFVAGCGGSSTTGAGGSLPTVVASQSAGAPVAGASTGATASADATAATTATTCPTSNTRAFAKTRFVTDLGGSAFLIRRYLYQPYTAGTFTKGHSGRRVALIKGAVAAATVVKLLKNATLNAKANPTLCKALAAPLAGLTDKISGLAGSLVGGGLDPGVLGGLGGTVTGLLGKAKAAGVPVTEQPVPAS